jgi:thioredoxin 1
MNEIIIDEFQKQDPNILTVLVFGAEWCGPCRVVSPIMDKLMVKYQDKKVVFYHVNVDEQKKFTSDYSIRSIPMVLFVKAGKVMEKVLGATSSQKYEEIINRLLP